MDPLKYTKKATKKLSQNLNERIKLTEKLKEFKTWSQVNSPKVLRPALSYALDWLAPELLGTGFRIFEISDFEVQGFIPALKSNLDAQFEIHQGLVTNSIFELSQVFMQRQMPDRSFHIKESEFNLSKKRKWNKNLVISLKVSQQDLDEFFVELQRQTKASIEFQTRINVEGTTQVDSATLKLNLQVIELIA